MRFLFPVSNNGLEFKAEKTIKGINKVEFSYSAKSQPNSSLEELNINYIIQNLESETSRFRVSFKYDLNKSNYNLEGFFKSVRDSSKINYFKDSNNNFNIDFQKTLSTILQD